MNGPIWMIYMTSIQHQKSENSDNQLFGNRKQKSYIEKENEDL